MDVADQNMSLVLSADAKPRLKWTPELHSQFVEAVGKLGGPDKATPKSVMELMKIPSLTLYHLKSHLQKFELGKSQSLETCQDKETEDCRHECSSLDDDSKSPKEINENSRIAQALQLQMEVQRQLHQQIEVQRHLQLRIEAQGKYLQSVLKTAQETLTGYNSLAKTELSELVSMVDNGCRNSSVLSDLTETESSRLHDLAKGLAQFTRSNNKRSSSTVSDATCLELEDNQTAKRCKKSMGLRLDLNSKYEDDSDPKE